MIQAHVCHELGQARNPMGPGAKVHQGRFGTVVASSRQFGMVGAIKTNWSALKSEASQALWVDVARHRGVGLGSLGNRRVVAQQARGRFAHIDGHDPVSATPRFKRRRHAFLVPSLYANVLFSPVHAHPEGKPQMADEARW